MGERELDANARALIDYLYDLAGCEDDLFARDLLKAFSHSSSESMDVLLAAARKQDDRQVARAAHRLKSTFSTLGMWDAERACALLEQSALTENHPALQEALLQVQAALALQEAQVRRLLAWLESGRV